MYIHIFIFFSSPCTIQFATWSLYSCMHMYIHMYVASDTYPCNNKIVSTITTRTPRTTLQAINTYSRHGRKLLKRFHGVAQQSKILQHMSEYTLHT